jgi:membrane protein YqaA with SNARE-associated domain
VQETLYAWGPYVGALAVGFVAGLIPIISIEVFMIVMSRTKIDTLPEFTLMIVLAAVGHQVSKTITYYAGLGALDRGKMKAKLDAVRPKIEKWNKRPGLVLLLAATVGLPPLYIIGFIAEPLMKIPFWRFTIVCFVGRVGRYFVMTLIPWLL